MTFATVGYGDLSPVDTASRLIVSSEILISLFMLAVVLSTAVAWVLSHRQGLLEARAETRNRSAADREELLKRAGLGLYGEKGVLAAKVRAKMDELRTSGDG